MKFRTLLRTIVAPALTVLFAAGSLAAQETGAVTGRVTAAATMEPLGQVQVFIEGTGLGTITDDDGRYRITAVPVGDQLVQARLLGYADASRTVSVQTGQAASANFELEESAVGLEDIVVTGTGTGGVARKRLGNTVSTIDTETLEDAPTENVSEILSGRQPGISISPSSGLAGEGQQIRIRGTSSLSQSNEPLVYIDGVRVNSGGGFGGAVGTANGGVGTGSSSRLDDIDPNSIERIEVLKGAAATTLYGTEASNGVIQIFTKAGREGGTRWTFEAEQGLSFMPTNRLIPHSDFGVDAEETTQLNEFWGLDLEPFEVHDFGKEQFVGMADETGRSTTVSASVAGGGSGITYFGSGRVQDLDGIYGMEDLGVARDKNQRVSGTANLNIFPNDRIRVQLRSNYTKTDQEAPEDANSIFAPFPLLFHSQPKLANENNLTGSPAFATVREGMQRTFGENVEHFGGSTQLTYSPSSAVSLNATLGADITSQTSEANVPFAWDVDNFTTSDVQGDRDIAAVTSNVFTLELRGGWEQEFGDWSSSFTGGGQGFLKQTDTRGGTGSIFPAAGFNVAEAAANQVVTETYLENVNAGLFVQEQVGYRDFAFLTLGGRWDANSAFGSTFDAVFYPKASFSVIPSDFSGWNSRLLSTLRFRGAVGQSGLQPGAFDKLRTFEGLPSTEGPGVAPDNLGNPDLVPEVSTEWEAGVELGLFRDRVGLEATYWNRTVDDVMVLKQFPITGGFNNLQLTNIGEMQGEGLDVSVNGDVLRGGRDGVSLNLFANAAYLTEEVTDLGGSAPIKSGGSYPRNRNFIREGFAPGAFFGAQLQDVPIPLDVFGNCTQPTESEALSYFSEPRSPDDFEVLPVDCGTAGFLDQYLGKPTPDWSGSVGADLGFLRNFSLRTLFEYKTGNFQHQDLSGAFRQSNAVIGRNTPETARIDATLRNPASTAEERLDAAIDWARNYRALAPMSGLNQIWDSDYIRWRELSLAYDAPSSFANSLSLDNLTITLRARNLALLVNDEYRGLDPELNNNSRCDAGALSGQNSIDCNFLQGQEAWRLPIPRRFTLGIRAGF